MAYSLKKGSGFPTRWGWERAFSADITTVCTKARGHLSSKHTKDPESCILCPLNRLHQEELVSAQD